MTAPKKASPDPDVVAQVTAAKLASEALLAAVETQDIHAIKEAALAVKATVDAIVWDD